MITRKLGAVGASVLLVAVGASSMTAQASTSSAASSAQAGTVAVTIDETRTITMPTTLQPGVNTFAVKGAKPGSFQLFQLGDGYTLEQADADIVKGLDKGDADAQKNFEANSTFFGGVSVVPGKTSKLVVDLPAGSFVALDTQTKKYKYATFTVAGADTGATVPQGKTIKAIKDITLAKMPASIPSKGWLTFKNASSQNHFLFVMPLLPGKTYKKDFVAWADSHFEGPPPVDFRKGFELGVIDPGQKETVKYRFRKGNYVALCFWPDANQGGAPHAMMGMHRGLTVK